MNKNETLSVVIPVFNEEASLQELIDRTLAACEKTNCVFEIILVDDGSRDQSRKMIEDASIKYPGQIIGLLLNRNYGQHAAVMAGFAQTKGDMIISLDADLQNPPEEIPNVADKMREGFDVVGTVRVPRQDKAFRKIGSWVVNRAAQKATGVNMNDYGCMLRGYRRHIIDAMLQCHERSTFIPILANSFARKTVEIEVNHSHRAAGDSKYSIWKLINLQFDLLTSMTTAPLRLLSVVGAGISFLGFAFGLFLIVMRLIHGPVWAAQGVFTLFAAVFIFIGAQFVAMGLLGEYIGRIYNDVRARPRYFIQSVLGKTQLETDAK
ncbi:MAG: glycosyltransferase [Spartobacteria bacterium]|nr:glycosyltransferase [Spartobacteria bacterium]